MKKLMIILLIIFLVGCKPIREISDDNKAKFESCQELPENKIKDCEYNTALEIGYVKYCYDLPSEDVNRYTKNECLMDIAEKHNDEKLCSYIKDKNGMNECFEKVAISSAKIETCDNINGEENRNNCINNLVVKNNDVRRCDYLYNSTKYIARNGYNRDLCIYFFINSTGNIKLCKSIQSLQVKELPLCR